jgi:spermidine synthase
LNNFQKYLSYVYRIVVEKTASEFNPELIVAIQNGKYVLNAKNANYSFASLHRVFQQAFNKIELSKRSIDSVLVLGCGAGSIPKIIYKELELNFKMDAIEIDKKVIELGNKYFDLDQYSNLNIVIDDALNYVKTTNSKYDLILVDLFKGINVPEVFLTQVFMEQLKSILNEEGEILMNFVAYNYETKQKVKEFEKMIIKTFPNHSKTYPFENINRIFHLIK